jgi:hypothetical protein
VEQAARWGAGQMSEAPAAHGAQAAETPFAISDLALAAAQCAADAV